MTLCSGTILLARKDLLPGLGCTKGKCGLRFTPEGLFIALSSALWPMSATDSNLKVIDAPLTFAGGRGYATTASLAPQVSDQPTLLNSRRALTILSADGRSLLQAYNAAAKIDHSGTAHLSQADFGRCVNTRHLLP